jgi:hypothetical protein
LWLQERRGEESHDLYRRREERTNMIAAAGEKGEGKP